jgi:16S rRNA U516 pseudouridylate synthase RsuA-like enzyme
VSVPAPDYWEKLPLGREVRLIARDGNGVAAFAKPAGVLSHPNTQKDWPRALLTCDYDAGRECFVWRTSHDCEARLWLLNRLDSATSGVILAAADENVARAVKDQFARRRVSKVYQALVFGSPRAPKEIWRDRLAPVRRGMFQLSPISRLCAGARASPRSHWCNLIRKPDEAINCGCNAPAAVCRLSGTRPTAISGSIASSPGTRG